MFMPYDNTTNIHVYCKHEITELWAMVGKYFENSPPSNSHELAKPRDD